MIKIVCAGIHRSGSTWLYNVVRLLYLYNKYSVYGCFGTNYDKENSAEVHVIKIHKYKREFWKANCIFTSRRDLRDIAASAIRRKLIENDSKQVFEYLDSVVYKEFNLWSARADMVIVYEEMIQNKPKHISKLAKKLNLELEDPLELHEKIENLPIKDTFDPVTQLHPNHITDGRVGSYAEILPEKTINMIEERYKAWLVKYKYIKEQ